jgi:hypothetical protein
LAKKVKIPVKEDTRQNSTQYGYQGNVRNQYGYSPADVDFYDDKDIVEKKDSRQAQVVDDSHEEKLYRLLFRISKKLKEEEEKAAVSSAKEPEIKAPQTPAASDPDPKSAASPDSKTSAESDEREAVVPISALSPKKTEAKDLEEPQNTASPANDSRDTVTAPPATAEAAAGANAKAETQINKEKTAVPNSNTSEESKSEESESAESKSEESDSEEKADVAEQPEHAQSATPSDNNADNSGKAQELPALAGAESEASTASVEEKSAPADELPEPEKKAASGGGSGGRIIDMADASMDGGPERVEQENTTLDKKEKVHLDTHSKAKAAKAGTKIGGLSINQKKKEDASTKLDKTKDAVEEKTSEKEAEVNAGQVGKVAETEAPEVNKDEAKSTLNQSLQASLPQTVEDVDNFKDNRIASKIGDKVKAAIDAKAGEVTGTFEVLDKTPQPDEPRKSVPFADIEQAPATPEINAGNNLIPKVDEKSIDLNSYLTESDNLLKKEGIKQEHLDLVDSGDLFEAKKIQKDIDKKAKEEPGNLRSEEKDLHGKNEAELQKKEADEKGKMEKERAAGLGSARGSQVGTKGSLEDKKKEVTDHINKIYEDVNKQVQDKLTKLKTDSLAAFDREEAAASSAFENNVNTKMDKFKDERYSGVGGKFNKVRDWFLGIDDLPEVKQIFEEEKSIYITRIDGAISKIINDSQKVIDECKTLIANARKEIEEYVKGLSPALQKIGEEAEKEIKKKLDELDEKVNKAAEELKEELAKKRAEAIANIDKKIEKMKEEMSGFLSKMGDLLVDAALKFFKWALETAGHSADEIMGIINKGKAVLTAVVSDPIQFLKNLAAAVGGGVKNFGANIMKHLGEGFMNWLTGQLNSLPIQLPEKFDLKGIVSLTLQVLGLTYASLRGKLSNKVGEDKVQMAETGVEMMMEVKEKGPIAMYDMMADKADSIKNEFIEGAKEWAITNMIKQGLIRLATMINPAGAIVQAVLGIYNGVIFLVNNWDRILAFVNSVFDSIAAIASGALGQASAFIEKTMAQTIPLILDFIAQQLNLSGIAERITKIIHRIRKPIDQVIDKVIDWITKKVKQLFGKGKNEKKENKDANKEEKENKNEKLSAEVAVNEISSRLQGFLPNLATKQNDQIGSVMYAKLIEEQKWVEAHVDKVNGKNPELLLIPEYNADQWWIKVKLNPEQVTTRLDKVVKGTGGSVNLNGENYLGLFHGSKQQFTSPKNIDITKSKNIQKKGTGLELGRGYYMAFYFSDVKGYAPISGKPERHPGDGWISKFLVPESIISKTDQADPDPDAPESSWAKFGASIKGKWKHIGDKKWKNGFQWVFKNQDVIHKEFKFAGSKHPYAAADAWGQGREIEYPEVFGKGRGPGKKEVESLTEKGREINKYESEEPQYKGTSQQQ